MSANPSNSCLSGSHGIEDAAPASEASGAITRSTGSIPRRRSRIAAISAAEMRAPPRFASLRSGSPNDAGRDGSPTSKRRRASRKPVPEQPVLGVRNQPDNHRRRQHRSAARRAVIKGIFAMSATQRTRGRLNMQPPGLNIYTPQSSPENACICRQQGLPGLPWHAGVPVRRACCTGTVAPGGGADRGSRRSGEREPGRDARMRPVLEGRPPDGRAAGIIQQAGLRQAAGPRGRRGGVGRCDPGPLG